MAIAHSQTVKVVGDVNATAVTTAAITTTTGNLTVVVCIWFGAGVTFTSMADSKGNTWTQIGSQQTTSGNAKMRMYYAKNITGGASHTFTLTVSANNSYPLLFVSEFSGIDTTSPFDVQAATTGSSTTPSSGVTATRAQADELLVGGLVDESSGVVTITAGTNFTIPTNGKEENGAANSTGAIEYQIVSSTGTDAGTFTISVSEPWGAQVATFKAPTTSVPAGWIPSFGFFKPRIGRYPRG